MRLAIAMSAIGLTSCFAANAGVITTLTLDRVEYADGGTATGSITLDYPLNGTATIASFDVTLTSPNLIDGYGGSVTMIGPIPTGPIGWFDTIGGPVGPNNTEQLVIYGIPSPSVPQLEFFFDVPNSLITGSPPVGPVQFDPTGQGYDGAWFLVVGGTAPESLVIGGTLDPTSTNTTPEPASITLLIAGFSAFLLLRRKATQA